MWNMGNFRDNRGGGGSFGRRDFGSRGGGDREMFRTTCSNCGKDCEVPFKPNGSRPVLCNDCFRNAGGNDTRRSEGRGGGRTRVGGRSKRRGRKERPQPNEKNETIKAKKEKKKKKKKKKKEKKKKKPRADTGGGRAGDA